MAANMINAEVGFTVKVIGSNKPIASAGPIPGSTPTSVPKKVPKRPNIRFVGVKTVWKPSSKSAKLLPIAKNPFKNA